MLSTLPIAVPAAIILIAFFTIVIGLAVRDREEDEEFTETGRRARDKASKLTGGIFGVIAIFLFGIFGALQQMGGAGIDVGFFLLDVLGANPEISGGVIASILGWLGMTGAIEISPFTYLGLSMVIIGIAFIYAAKRRVDRRAAFD